MGNNVRSRVKSLWRTAIASLLAVALAACQASWVTLDGRRADAAELRAAESACRIDERRAELEAAEAERARRMQASSNNAATMLAREDFDLRVRKIRAALENCMRERGFRPD